MKSEPFKADHLVTYLLGIRFDLQIDGKSIAKILMHNGLAARTELGKCLSGKPYAVTQIDLMGNKYPVQPVSKP